MVTFNHGSPNSFNKVVSGSNNCSCVSNAGVSGQNGAPVSLEEELCPFVSGRNGASLLVFSGHILCRLHALC